MGLFKKDPLKVMEKELKNIQLDQAKEKKEEEKEVKPEEPKGEYYNLDALNNKELVGLIGKCFIRLSETTKVSEVKNEPVKKTRRKNRNKKK